jgi:membrane dipeptidase
MVIFDAHNDLPSSIYRTKESFFSNTHHIDLLRMKQSLNHSFVLCCALFMNERKVKNLFLQGLNILDYFTAHLMRYQNEVGILTFQKPVSIIFSIEGGSVFEGKLKNLDVFYEKGVRLVSLTWNYSNQLAGGCLDPSVGVSPLGRKFLKRMEEKSVILDLSHVSDQSFDEICSFYKGKVIASHSNVRQLCPHRRNLTDQQMLKIQQRFGVIGINLYPKFLGNKKKVTLDDVIMHIEYIASLIGISGVGFGFDFEGVDELPKGIRGIQDVEKIINRLLQLNYAYEEVEKIAGKNFMRVFQYLDSNQESRK